jgi:hypothetical protein
MNPTVRLALRGQQSHLMQSRRLGTLSLPISWVFVGLDKG